MMKVINVKRALSCAIALALLQGCSGGGGGGTDSSTAATPSGSSPSGNSVTSGSKSIANDALQNIHYVKASNTGSGDTFGWSVSMSDDGNILAVGAPAEDGENNSRSDSGAVYVFIKTDGGWQQQAYIKADHTLAGAGFGASIALSGDASELVVGAPFEDGNAGSVYVFNHNGNAWTQQTRLKPSNTYGNAYFGWSVALADDGGTVAIGSPGEANAASTINANDHSASDAGAVYVLKRAGDGSWGGQIYLKATTVVGGDNFGAAIALNGPGNILAVGAPYKSSSGIAYVFAHDGATWGAPALLSAKNSDAGDNFGAALAIDTAGDVLAIGAPYEASAAKGIGGSQADNTALNAGAAYIFVRSGSSWSQNATYVKATNTDANDDFGTALALSSDGNSLAVGAIGESSGAIGRDGDQTDNSKDGVGAVYLFKHDSSGWAQQTYMKPSASTVGAEFGTAIGMSKDGAVIAITGAFEQSSATGIDGNPKDTNATDAGALWLF